jgi:hypothetical protein
MFIAGKEAGFGLQKGNSLKEINLELEASS